MLNYSEIFHVIHADRTTGRAVWAGPAGTRTAHERDGIMMGLAATASRPREWHDKRIYADAELARPHPRQYGI